MLGCFRVPRLLPKEAKTEIYPRERQQHRGEMDERQAWSTGQLLSWVHTGHLGRMPIHWALAWMCSLSQVLCPFHR